MVNFNKTLLSFDDAFRFAVEIFAKTGEMYLACDNGEDVSPRFQVIPAPKIGEAVSQAFNGAIYPCGFITAIEKGYQMVQTSTGMKFWRFGQGKLWTRHGWVMVGRKVGRVHGSEKNA